MDSLVLTLLVGLPAFLICGLIGAVRAKRRGDSRAGVTLSSVIFGFVGAIGFLVAALVVVMVMWGASI